MTRIKALALELVAPCIMAASVWAMIMMMLSPLGWQLIYKIPACLLLVVIAFIALDSTLGLLKRILFGLKPIEVSFREGRGNRLYVILPGFNQDGLALADVLVRLLETGSILFYRLPRDGFDQRAVVKAMLAGIKQHSNAETMIVVYAESAGLRDLNRMFQADDGLIVDHLVTNAGITGRTDLLAAKFVRLAYLVFGGPFTTFLLRIGQRDAVRKSPELSPDLEPAASEAAEFANQNSLNITAVQASAELRRMCGPRIEGNTFAGRVVKGTYLMGPGTSDAFVWTEQASGSLAIALDATNGSPEYRIVSVEEWVDRNGGSLHTPTPAMPEAVLLALIG